MVLVKTPGASGKRGSTAKGISFSVFAGISSLGAGLLLLPVVLSTVGASAYGTWLFLSAVASFLFFLDLGVGTAIVHFLSRSRSGDKSTDPNTVASTGHAWAFVACLVAIAIFVIVAANYSEEAIRNVSAEEFSIMVFAGICVLATMIVRPMSSVLFGSGFLHIERTYQVWGTAVRIIGTLSSCWMVGNITGVVLAETAALMVPPVIAACKVSHLKLVQIHWKHISALELKRMMRYSLGAFSVSMVGASILQFGTVITGILGSADQVSYFNAAFRVYASVRQVISWLTDPFRSVMSRLYVNDRQRASSVLYDLLFVAFVASAMGCLVLFITLPMLLQLWLGETVPIRDVTSVSCALLAGLLLNALHIPLIPASDAAGSPGAFLLHQTVWLISYAGLAMLLFPLWGILGVALAMTTPLPLIEFAYLRTASRTVNLDYELWFKRVARPVLPVLVLGLLAVASVTYFPQPLWVITTALLFVATTFTFLAISRRSWSHTSVMASLRMEA